jgi:hypothetical protein
MKIGIASLEWKVVKMQNHALDHYSLAPRFWPTSTAIYAQTGE